ncbi:glycoside hydrolase family 127 protein [Xanthomonas campestris pv. campestris]|uniref:glycoside hydrolase family 127 protein n=1 Tax=Xanthomonas campestris TaxID=339 RepID=UPI002AD59DC5|nr:glycoside hydrolase family 127 protein [Xanthomonas campestris]MEA0738370.1 glycoside hydrolase family 127 protein [Xanthomonas campestris pv. campestris]
MTHAHPNDDVNDAALSLSRRRFLAWSSLAVAAGFLRFPAQAAAAQPGSIRAVPLAQVRLMPSLFLDALHTNRRYLMRLQPDRLLHNFVLYAGLDPKAPAYGGWEADTIAGHTLGHYLSALALMHAQTDDAQCRTRASYLVAELARCQAHAGDGYVAGFTRKNAAGQIESGRAVFDELKRGKIEPLPFYLNGSWAPLYTWHKLFAGLLDVHAHCDNAQALQVAVALASYLQGIFAALDDTQLQKVLSCEFGGLNESFVELHVRTGDAQWLALAQRLHHRAVLDPLVAQRDELVHQHSNTNIPKLIGLAREYEVTGDAASGAAARFFWNTVTDHHSYVIGGNGDREYFQQPDSISKFLTEQTCEHCSSYNMLKLTRHLYQWGPQAAYFDYYERTLLNHVMAQQHPRTGMFTYMTPMLAGEARGWSSPFDDFWCCVGSGMEAHAQFGDSIYWEDGQGVYVNLYVPSSVRDAAGLDMTLHSTMPEQGSASLRIDAAPAEQRTLALRVPGWAQSPVLQLNGQPVDTAISDGYLRITRVWRAGDMLKLSFEMPLRLEATPDDPAWVSVLRGPLVLAADLGDAATPWSGKTPALIGGDEVLQQLQPAAEQGSYVYSDGGQHWRFSPFYAQFDRRSAVYLEHRSANDWQQRQAEQDAAAARQHALDASALDWVALGDDASEKAHALQSDGSYALSYRRRAGRDARTGGFIAFTLRNTATARVLRLRYWGDETRRRFRILADGELIANERLDGNRGLDFVDVDYALPAALAGRATLQVRIEPETGYSAGPAFGCWVLESA